MVGEFVGRCTSVGMGWGTQQKKLGKPFQEKEILLALQVYSSDRIGSLESISG